MTQLEYRRESARQDGLDMPCTMEAAMKTLPSYIYGDDWIARVSKDSQEWRAYCEAVALLKRYFRIKIAEGKEAAQADHYRYLGLLAGEGDKRGRAHRTPEAIERLRADFLLIGRHEGERIQAAVLKECQQRANREGG